MVKSVFTYIFSIVICCNLLISCKNDTNSCYTEVSLNDIWTCYKNDDSIGRSCNIPLKVNFEVEKNEKKSQIRLRKVFEVSTAVFESEEINLQIDGLNEYSEIYLNDSLIGNTENELLTYIFDCKRFILKNVNELEIVIDTQNLNHTNVAIKSISLQAWSFAKIEDLTLQPIQINSKLAEYTVHYSVHSTFERVVSLEFRMNKKVIWKADGLMLQKGENKGSFEIKIAKPKIWKSNGLGDANLYQVSMKIEMDKKLIHEQKMTLGIRNLEVLKTDSTNAKVKLNLQPLYLKGLELSSQLFDSGTISKEKIRQIVYNACDMNMNTIRVPNDVYLEHFFYEYCNEKGILIWQNSPKKNFDVISDGIFNKHPSVSFSKIDIENFIKSNFTQAIDSQQYSYYYHVAHSLLLKKEIEMQRCKRSFALGTICSSIDNAESTWNAEQYTVKNSFSHILVQPMVENDKISIYSSSNALKDMDAILLVKLIDFEGKKLFVQQIPVVLKANSANVILQLPKTAIVGKNNLNRCFLFVQINQPNITLSQNILYFLPIRQLQLPKPTIDVRIHKTVKGYNLILRTNTLAKNIFFETKSKKSRFAENNFDLLPDTRTKISVEYEGTKDELMNELTYRTIYNK